MRKNEKQTGRKRKYHELFSEEDVLGAIDQNTQGESGYLH